jgi:integrase
MRKKITPLSATDVSKSKPGDADYKMSDGQGLYLLVTAKGGKCWRFDYTYGVKRKTLALGTFPEITLAKARAKRSEARELIANGIDPGEIKKAQKATKNGDNANSFEVVAREWHARFTPSWAPAHAKTTIDRLTRDVFLFIGAKSIEEIEAMDLLAVLRRVEARGALETAHRVKTICGQVFRYAVATGRAKRDIAADLKGALPPANKSHLAALTDPDKVAGLLRAIDDYQGSFIVKSALQIAPMVFVRPGELRHAEWAEIDFDTAIWNIPAGKMKMKVAHIVPLSKQVIEVLRALQPLTGAGQYLFPGGRSATRPLSNNAINAALRRMGYSTDEMTGHGFRAMARTILDEVLQIRPDFIEHQLAHAVRDPNGRAYNRTAHLEERKKMMNTWADYLDGLKLSAQVIPFRVWG